MILRLKWGCGKSPISINSDGSLKMSQIFGNTLEAVVGAIYLDKGYDKTRQWGNGADYTTIPFHGGS